MITYEASISMVELLEVQRVKSEQVLLDDALHRLLALDIIAPSNYPEVPTASMDGYAIIASDQSLNRLKIDDSDNPAGSAHAGVVTTGYAIKTFTGAMMPEGADTLIPIEKVRVEGNELEIVEPVDKGFSVRPVAESYAKGDVLITKGERLDYVHIGILAGLNVVHLRVVKPPVVSVIATGSEVLDLGDVATSAAQIRSSNSYMLSALAKRSGAQVLQQGIIPDDKASIIEGFKNALDSSDIVVSSGGVSVGDYDFVKEIVPKLGATVVFKGVLIKPGQHVMVAQLGEKFIVALPGFALSSCVTALLYLVPLIKKLMGLPIEPERIEATLSSAFTKRSNKKEFTPCNLRFEEGRYLVDFEGKKSGSSANLINLLGSSALMITAQEDKVLEAGTTVSVMKIF